MRPRNVPVSAKPMKTILPGSGRRTGSECAGSVDPHWSSSLVGIDPPCLSGQLIKSEGRIERRRAAPRD
jgi:hypothetical protein